MKRFLLVLAALCVFAGCSDADPDVSSDLPYLGSILLTDGDGNFAGVCAGVSVVVERSGEAGTLTLCGAKFDEAMPPTDLRFGPVRCVDAEGALLISGDAIVPCNPDGSPLGGEFTVRELRGELYNGELTLAFCIGALHASYRGYRLSDR